MSLFTSNYLKGLSKNKSLNESIQLNAQSSAGYTSFDIFLCHSFLDAEEVEGLYLELTKQGFRVYVDWITDPHLNRNDVTEQTAAHIRKRLRSSKSLLLALSHNAQMSKWVPWELGYVDGHTQQCALVPISRDNVTRTSFHRTEYLQLYPYIEKPNDLTLFSNRMFAVDSAFKYIDLDSWVKGAAPKHEYRKFF